MLSNAGLKRRGVTSPDGTPLPKETLTPPTMVDTCVVALAFLEASRFKPDADPPPALRAAVDLIHNAVQAAGGTPDRNTLGLASPLVEKYCYTRTFDQALAMEVLLRRQGPPDQPRAAPQARLHARHDPRGSRPPSRPTAPGRATASSPTSATP